MEVRREQALVQLLEMAKKFPEVDGRQAAVEAEKVLDDVAPGRYSDIDGGQYRRAQRLFSERLFSLTERVTKADRDFGPDRQTVPTGDALADHFLRPEFDARALDILHETARDHGVRLPDDLLQLIMRQFAPPKIERPSDRVQLADWAEAAIGLIQHELARRAAAGLSDFGRDPIF